MDDPKMKVILVREWTMPDGTKCKLSIETEDGQPISSEDQEIINRFLPLTEGKLGTVQ